MKKISKANKRVQLKSETIRRLTGIELRAPRGGYVQGELTFTCTNRLDCGSFQGCHPEPTLGGDSGGGNSGLPGCPSYNLCAPQ